MRSLPPRFRDADVEVATAAFWKARGLPESDAPTTPSAGSPVHMMVTSLTAVDSPLSFLQRAIRGDAEARFLRLNGRAVRGRLMARDPADASVADVERRVIRAGVWLGGARVANEAEIAPVTTVQAMVDRLATDGMLLSRELPLRACPACRTPRSPEGLVYAAEVGDAYLLRFLVEGPAPQASLLVWVDAAWKLLGTSAVLVHPELPYVRARFRRRGQEETVLVARSAIPRLGEWLGGAEVEVLEEKRGADLAGLRYLHPLATEFPTLSSLPPPAGQVACATEVDDSGTGVVALVPGHGASDAAVAHRLGLPGWPVLSPEGRLLQDLQHKYAGLGAEIAEAFILRDLFETGMLFAQLRVRRGVPHCGVCGTRLSWQPARAWCLDLGQAPEGRRAVLTRFGLVEPLPRGDDAVAWPVSESTLSAEPDAVRLLECPACGRLAPIRSSPERCPCGATWKSVARRLLASFRDPLSVWAAERPFAEGDAVRLVVPVRRREATRTLHAVAAGAAGAAPGEVRTVAVTTLPPEDPAWGEASSDSWRATLLRLGESGTVPDEGLGPLLRQESRRLRRIWHVSRELLDHALEAGLDLEARPLTARSTELLEEDRAILSSFERLRADVVRDYEAGAIDRAHERLVRFFDDRLRGEYLPQLRPRLNATGPEASRTTAVRVLGHLVLRWVELYAPIAPFTMEAIHRAARGDAASLFERGLSPREESLLDSAREQGASETGEVLDALASGRRELRLGVNEPLPAVVLLARDDTRAERLRALAPSIGRLGAIQRVEVVSPTQPWKGRTVRVRPLTEEIQRAYPFQAQRLVRMLESMPPVRVRDGVRAGTLELVLESRPLPITPAMVEVSEELPPGIAPVAWSGGEMYLELPPKDTGDARPLAPALSSDGFAVLRALRRRLARASAPSAIDRVAIRATGELGQELTRAAPAISTYLQGRDISVNPEGPEFPPEEGVSGRTGRGALWTIWVPGVRTSRDNRPRRPAAHRPRLRTAKPVAVGPTEADFLDPARVRRDAEIREAVESFDHALGRPLIGPTKLVHAWDAGLDSFDRIAHAPYETLTAVPGFGPVLAEQIVVSFGGTVPPRARRSRPSPAPREELPPSAIPPTGPGPHGDVSPAPKIEPPAPMTAPLASVAEPAEPLGAPRTAEADSTAQGASDQALPRPLEPLPEPIPIPGSTAPAREIAAPVRSIPTDHLTDSTPADRPTTVADTPLPPPAAEEVVAPPAAPGGLEVFPEGHGASPWGTFLELTGGGAPGLCLSREFPERLRYQLAGRNVQVVWLSNVGREGSIRPGDLDRLRALFRSFLSAGTGRVAYLEGVEYLLRIHGSERTLAFLRELRDLAASGAARVFLPANPALMEPAAWEAIAAEFPAD